MTMNQNREKANVKVLLQVGDFITSNSELQFSSILMMMIRTKSLASIVQPITAAE